MWSNSHPILLYIYRKFQWHSLNTGETRSFNVKWHSLNTGETRSFNVKWHSLNTGETRSFNVKI